MGIPENSVREYEHAMKADYCLVFVHGTAGDVARAKSILATIRALSEHTDSIEDSI